MFTVNFQMWSSIAYTRPSYFETAGTLYRRENNSAAVLMQLYFESL